MYFDHIVYLELHVHFIAATMHWEAKSDEWNVEFVLGDVPGDDEAFLPP
jgi:hypothetical protein